MSTRETRNSNSKKVLKTVALAVFSILIAGRFLFAGPAHTAVGQPENGENKPALQEKIDKFKEFKAKYEDKDFRLIGTPVKRTEISDGNAKTYYFNVYHIAYGITEDNFREYNAYSKQIVRTPAHSSEGYAPVCQSGLYVQESRETETIPEATCLEEAKNAYPISLILKTFSKEEMENVVLIYQFEDGDVDIRFSFDQGRDKKFVESLFKKLTDADEIQDAQRPMVGMQPLIPTENQKLTAVFLDEDKDGEPDSVFLPYCLNGSYFDQDPDNNSFQVGFKYKLVTQKDLVGKSLAEKKALKERMGLWMWDKPSEILASFSENPGPDIVFYDIGKVVDSVVVEAEPDGEFDRYEFLY